MGERNTNESRRGPAVHKGLVVSSRYGRVAVRAAAIKPIIWETNNNNNDDGDDDNDEKDNVDQAKGRQTEKKREKLKIIVYNNLA